MILAKRIQQVSTSPTLAINAKAKQMKAAGKKIINLGAGEPDFDTPDYIKQEAIRAIQNGYTKYTPAAGSPELKEAVCEKLHKENKLDYTPREVIINCGAKHSIYNILQVLVNSGDEVIIPSPYWVTYPEAVKLAGGKPKILPTADKQNFKITSAMLRRTIRERTKVLILNSPSNPTGSVYTEKELKAIMQIAIAKKIWVISDEIYEHLIYDRTEHISPASVSHKAKHHTIIVNGVSKAFSMTGWRIGYTAGPEEVISAITTLQSHSTSNPCSISMKAAWAALSKPPQMLRKMKKAFKERRDYIVAALNKIDGITCLKPEGAFYVFPNVSECLGRKYGDFYVANSLKLAEYLLEKAEVAVVPGNGFGADEYMRLSYATSMDNIKHGIERIRQALN